MCTIRPPSFTKIGSHAPFVGFSKARYAQRLCCTTDIDEACFVNSGENQSIAATSYYPCGSKTDITWLFRGVAQVIRHCLRLVQRLLAAAFIVTVGCFHGVFADTHTVPVSSADSALEVPITDNAINSGGVWFLDLSYETGEFSDGFIELIFEYGARTPSFHSERTTLEDYVFSTCGYLTDSNIRLFSLALEEQGFTEIIGEAVFVKATEEQIQLPPCLPSYTIANDLRVVLDEDSVFRYFEADISCQDCLNSLWNTDDQSVELREKRLRLEVEPKISQFEDISRFKFVRPSAINGQIKRNIQGMEIVNPLRDDSEVAAFALVAILRLSIDTDLNDATQAIIAEIRKSRPDSATQIETVISKVLSNFQKDGVKLPDVLTNILAISRAHHATLKPNRDGSALDYRSNVLRLSPQFGLLPSVKGVTVGDLVFSPRVFSTSARLPIDLEVVARKQGLIDFQADAAERAATEWEQIRTLAESTFRTLLKNVDPLKELEVANLAFGEDTSVVFSSITSTENDVCALVDPPRDYDSETLAALLEPALHTRMRMAETAKTPEAVTIGIADSGFIYSQVETSNPFEFSVRSPVSRNDEQPLAGFEGDMRNHGTAVSGVAIGGPTAWALAQAIGVDLEIVPYRIYAPNLQGAGKKAVVMVPLLRRLLGTEPTIINLSIGELSEAGENGPIQDAIGNFLTENTGPLFIIAAGNNGANNLPSGQEVETTRLYPQTEGAVSRNNAIVVGSTDGDTLAKFSNFSKEAVAILAPGCGIDSWYTEDPSKSYKISQFNGTSFSAPLVAYIAALVRSLSPEDRQSSKYVKARILASADLRGSLVTKVEDGRVLNPAKAITLYDDIVEMRQTENNQEPQILVRGSFQPDISLQRLCQPSPAQNGVLLKFAVSPQPDAGDDYIYYVWNESQGIVSGHCRPRDSVNFRKEGAAAFTAIPLAEVVDIVFRWRTSQ